MLFSAVSDTIPCIKVGFSFVNQSSRRGAIFNKDNSRLSQCTENYISMSNENCLTFTLALGSRS